MTDSATGITTTYYYDFTQRLMKYVESGSGTSHSVQYGYDDINNLTSLVETINGTAYTTSYGYDDDNRLTSIVSGSVSKTYGYDVYSRVSGRTTKYGTSTVLTDTLTYLASATNGGTTGQVGSLRSQAAGYDVTYTYTYDNNGNILTVSDGTNTTSYVYDSANQLTRENNQAANKTWTWTYDNAGNITARKEYAYTTGALGTAIATVNYTYGDSQWGDLLTGYNGNTISSDAIGNMLSDGTWTYTWEHGRELATMSNGTTTWTYTYNADGMRTSRSSGTTTYSYAELFSNVASESISKAKGLANEESTLDVIPHIRDILSNSIRMGVEKIVHTDGKGTALYGYRLYNLYLHDDGKAKTPHCLACTVVQNLGKAEGYVFQNIENVTIDQGLPGNKTGMPSSVNGNTYTVAQLYRTVKKIDRFDGGLKYTAVFVSGHTHKPMDKPKTILDYPVREKEGHRDKGFSPAIKKEHPFGCSFFIFIGSHSGSHRRKFSKIIEDKDIEKVPKSQ